MTLVLSDLAQTCPIAPEFYPVCSRRLPGVCGWHYLSNATCLMRPRLFYACFVVWRTIVICYTIWVALPV